MMISDQTRDLLTLYGAATAVYLQKAIAEALAEGDEERALALDGCLLELEQIPLGHVQA